MNKNYSWEVIKCLDFICDCSCNDVMWCEVKIPTALMPHWALLVITFQPTRTTISVLLSTLCHHVFCFGEGGGGGLNSERRSALCLNVMLFVCRNFRQWRKYVLPYQKKQNCSHWAPCRILYSSLVNIGTDCFKATLVSTRGRAGTVLACVSTLSFTTASVTAVIIQSLKDTPPLNDGSIIFKSDREAAAKVRMPTEASLL